jgi:hypothetical protein
MGGVGRINYDKGNLVLILTYERTGRITNDKSLTLRVHDGYYIWPFLSFSFFFWIGSREKLYLPMSSGKAQGCMI